MEFEISGTKIASGDILEQARLLFLANTPAFKILARKQGFEVKDLNDLDSLYNQNLNRQISFDFVELFKLIPINNINLLGSKGKFKIVK